MFPCKLFVPDLSTTLKTAPPVRLYSAANAFLMAWDSETASGDGSTAMFSANEVRFRLPSRYQAFAPPDPAFTERSEPSTCVGSGKVPNSLLKPKFDPGGPPTGFTPGIK